VDVDEAAIATAVASAMDIAATVQSVLAGTEVVIIAPVAGQAIDLTDADAYEHDDGTAITITKASGETWPTTLTTVYFNLAPNPQGIAQDSLVAATHKLTNIACTVTQATGGSQAFRLELTTVQMDTLAASVNGYDYEFVANKATNPKVVRRGTATVRARLWS
jgi:hypothetical protein